MFNFCQSTSGKGKRNIWQEYFVEGSWISGSKVSDDLKASLRQAVTPYKYAECSIAAIKGERIFWVEGEPCADALWGLGMAATTTIGGSDSYSKYGDYSGDFPGVDLVLCPDRDIMGLKYANAVFIDRPDALWCYAYPESPIWERLPKTGGLDIADWIEELRKNGQSDEQIRDRINGAIESKRELEILQSEPQKPEPLGEEVSCSLARRYQRIELVVGKRLRFNALTKEIELNEQVFDLDELQVQLALRYGIQVPDNQFGKIISSLARKNNYSPVIEYLKRVQEQHGSETSILSNLATQYLGTDNPLYDIYLRKTLIAAVARAMEPGCKVDTALILQGKQGYNKSTFLKSLASPGWFDDTFKDVSSKDELLKLHQVWFVEWAELESVFKRRDLANVKAFLTTTRDRIRLPYGRSVLPFDRCCMRYCQMWCMRRN